MCSVGFRNPISQLNAGMWSERLLVLLPSLLFRSDTGRAHYANRMDVFMLAIHTYIYRFGSVRPGYLSCSRSLCASDHFRQSYKIISLFLSTRKSHTHWVSLWFSLQSIVSFSILLWTGTLWPWYLPCLLYLPQCRSHVNYFVCFFHFVFSTARLSGPPPPGHLLHTFLRRSVCRNLNAVVDNIMASSNAAYITE